MLYYKAKHKQKAAYSHSYLLWVPELHCLLTRQVWTGTQGPPPTTVEALQLYDDCLHFKWALW